MAGFNTLGSDSASVNHWDVSTASADSCVCQKRVEPAKNNTNTNAHSTFFNNKAGNSVLSNSTQWVKSCPCGPSYTFLNSVHATPTLTLMSAHMLAPFHEELY